MSTCVQTCGEYRNFYPCGRRAKFIDPKNRLLCGTHRAVVDRYYERINSSDRCQPLEKERDQ